jgi:sarcosine oxidase
VKANLALAARDGAELRVNEAVRSVEQDGAAVRVTTDRGEYRAAQAIVTAGAGVAELVPALRERFIVSRQVQYWFAATGLEDIPVWIWELQGRDHAIYGFPSHGGVAKVATESFTREISPEEMYASLVEPFVRGVRAPCVKTVPCLYTATRDFRFAIDRHPTMDRVIVASPCSGHGFKHSAAIGEALAQWALEGKSAIDLGPFSRSRSPG